jgi:transcription-repair coupling factor (superfamily II helicase)
MHNKYLALFNTSTAGFWLNYLLEQHPTTFQQTWCVFENEQDVYIAKHTINAFNPSREVLIYPAWDTLPYAATSPSINIQLQRQSVLKTLHSAQKPYIVLSTINAATQKVAPAQAHAPSVTLQTNQSLDIPTLINTLTHMGFERIETVYQEGQYSIRGGIIDVFLSNTLEPYRIDLFGDTVESIHTFNPSTQRRNAEQVSTLHISSHQEILLTPAALALFKHNYLNLFGVEGRGAYFKNILNNTPNSGWQQLYPLFFEHTQTVFEALPNVTFIVPPKPTFNALFQDIEDGHTQRKKLWDAVTLKENQLPPIPAHTLYCNNYEHDILRHANVLVATPLKKPDALDCGIKPLNPLNGETITDKIKAACETAASANKQLIFAATDVKDIKHFQHSYSSLTNNTAPKVNTLIEASAQSATTIIWSAHLHEGFQTPSQHIVTPIDIFGARKKTFKRSNRTVNPEDIISHANSISPGDLAVHIQHGIGQYIGLKTVEVFNVTHDCLLLEYAGQDKLYLPVENIELLSRYGSEQGSVSLDKLGGTAWQNRQLKVKKQLRTIAKYLIDIAAQRTLKTAPVLNPKEGLYDEFCARFKFVETEDQEKAILDVIEDLSKGTPMDRLVCGDVGFGKTEIALRAAFLAVSQGYQVGIIAPTTILARQHYHTFKKRFEGLGFCIEQISRLVKPSETKRIKNDVLSGNVAILIGTHAILSAELKFKNLGLLIVDEEQMFGVKQKEKIKELCENVHVLTLTATPIPRTLQMSLLGIKEMSLIATPPIDRRAIHTTLCEEDPVVIHQAIQHETQRQGQVFYVCPRITDIDDVYRKLNDAFPNLKIVIAHGQLKPADIESRLLTFIEGQADILISTQIIESGIDISNANTMIIHNAHLFGLSQLYQLRGRIGRSNRQAYAYLTYPYGKHLNPSAVKRLQVMSTLDALGAGFTLASHDLDIRGAGNLLGEEQSGHIKEVGVELYQDMLKQTIGHLKKNATQEDEDLWSPTLSLGISVGLPETYIQNTETRMEIYQKIGTIHTNEALSDMRLELFDRFGPLPETATNLLETIKIKNLCRPAYIQKVEVGPNGALFTFYKNKCNYVDPLLALIKTNTAYKLRPDSKLFYQWGIEDPIKRVQTVASICLQLLNLKNAL